MRYDIDLRGIESRGELHDLLWQTLRLPDYYGRNLDALHDVLSETGGGLELHFLHAEEAGEQLGDYLSALRRMCDELEAELPGFSAVWEEDEPVVDQEIFSL